MFGRATITLGIGPHCSFVSVESVIFRPYGRKFIRIYTLFSVRRDGNLQLNFAIFRPYGRKIAEFND